MSRSIFSKSIPTLELPPPKPSMVKVATTKFVTPTLQVLQYQSVPADSEMGKEIVAQVAKDADLLKAANITVLVPEPASPEFGKGAPDASTTIKFGSWEGEGSVPHEVLPNINGKGEILVDGQFQTV